MLWISSSGGISATVSPCPDWRAKGTRELILYRIAANAAADAFLKHEHIGGEFYLVLRGKIADETGEYGEGDLVFLDPKSVHMPRAVGDTVVLVLWPEGVRIVD